jgi:alpha/beta superfamily hydrolase
MLPYDLAEAETPWAYAVLLHPHPDMGGDRHNNVVSALFDALPPAGVTALRFDFSSSNVEVAAAETREALELLEDAPRFLVAYSFGGGVAATIDDPSVAGWFLIAPALTMVEPTIGDDPRPKAIVAAEHDHFFSPGRLEAASDGWIETEHMTVTGADHMFVGRTDEVANQALAWLKQVAR